MDPQLQQKLAEILDYLLKQTQDAVQFGKEQIPLIAWEQVAFARVWYGLMTLLLVVFVAMFWAVVYKRVRVAVKSSRDSDAALMTWVAIVAGHVFVFMTFIDVGKTFVLAMFAPRVYLLQWAAELIKGVK